MTNREAAAIGGAGVLWYALFLLYATFNGVAASASEAAFRFAVSSVVWVTAFGTFGGVILFPVIGLKHYVTNAVGSERIGLLVAVVVVGAVTVAIKMAAA